MAAPCAVAVSDRRASRRRRTAAPRQDLPDDPARLRARQSFQVDGTQRAPLRAGARGQRHHARALSVRVPADRDLHARCRRPRSHDHDRQYRQGDAAGVVRRSSRVQLAAPGRICQGELRADLRERGGASRPPSRWRIAAPGNGAEPGQGQRAPVVRIPVHRRRRHLRPDREQRGPLCRVQRSLAEHVLARLSRGSACGRNRQARHSSASSLGAVMPARPDSTASSATSPA